LLLYIDGVPFGMVDSAALILSKNCGGGGQIFSYFDHHNINEGAVTTMYMTAQVEKVLYGKSKSTL
jgi:hypothetical protein